MEDVLIEEVLRLRKQNERLTRRLARKCYHTAKAAAKRVYHIVRPIKEDTSHFLMEDVPTLPIEKGRVDIINVNFYDWDGNSVVKGGAERYVYDLAKLLQALGYNPRILQGANSDFEKEYRGIKVIGVKAPNASLWWLSKIFPKACAGAEFVISSPFELAAEIHTAPCIGINHSVRYDNPSSKILTELPKDLVNPYALTFEALKNMKICVCTDTNFVNWVRTRDHELSKKILYVPNCYDERVFKPTKKTTTDKIVFVFPRRIEESRGHKITLEAYKRVVKRFPNTELRIIGQIEDDDAQKDVDLAIAEFPDNISHTQYDMEDSYKAFRDVDVMLAPTIYMEGMSLSCLEALASGVPIIATTVGGLPNLVIDHYNGFLIPTTVDDLEKAMIELIQNSKLREKMGKRSLDMAHSAFTRQLWEDRWKDVIKRFLQ